MVKRRVVKKRVKHSVHKRVYGLTQGTAICVLLLNLFILPGLGSLIGRRTKEGAAQVILVAVSIPLMFIYFMGVPLLIGAWIWGLVTGIKMIKNSK